MATLDTIRQRQDSGDHLQAADLAQRLFEAEPGNREALYRLVLNIARAGATDRALEIYTGAHLDELEDSEFISLRARIEKDLALASVGDERTDRLRGAAELYRRAFRIAGEHYPCVNAATLLLLAGDETTACDLAEEALEACTREMASWRDQGCRPEAESAHDLRLHYYNAVSRAEGHLILGEIAETMLALTDAARLNYRRNHSDRAGTRRQLDMICTAKGLNSSILDLLRPPDVLHYVGHMLLPERVNRRGDFTENTLRERIAAYFDKQGPAGVGFLYGSLACGSDILIAEAALNRGIELNVVMPFDPDLFIQRSVRPAGEEWIPRFQRCLDAAESVTQTGASGEGTDDVMLTYASRTAMGLAVLRAQYLGTTVRQLAVWDGIETERNAGTAVDIGIWKQTDRKTDVISVRRRIAAKSAKSVPEADYGAGEQVKRVFRAFLFGDIAGFSRIDETELPLFYDTMWRAVSKAMAPFEPAIEFSNTWGDAIHVVFSDATAGAHCALSIQETLRSIAPTASFPHGLGMRLSVHYAPVYARFDPILARQAFFGTNITKAARMEPITPVGEVYATEPLAAELALSGVSDISAEYVGIVPLAKDYGAFRMHALRRWPVA